jgi:transcriptional regulator with XRE-family HTH domain
LQTIHKIGKEGRKRETESIVLIFIGAMLFTGYAMKKKMAGVDSQEERETFGQNVRHQRLAQRLRQRDLHLLTGIAQSHICEIETGTCNLAIDTMVKLAHAVKTPLWKLLKPNEATEDETPPESDARSAPRSRQWHEDNVTQVVFEFNDAEMRKLRKAAARVGLTVTDFLRRLLDDAGGW